MIVVLEKAICIWYKPNKTHTTVAPPMNDKKNIRKTCKPIAHKKLNLHN